ncbi:MAG TPA: hypothetical protein VM935_17670 [Chitinophagaceae bacterium]|nr:hypothetical protein [Chitinophagaceae bacterium]
MNKYFIYISFWLLVSCTNSDTKIHKGADDSPHANASDTIMTPKPLDVASGCYRMLKGNDSAFLTLAVMDSAVSGNLEYNLYGKDKNSGTIKGFRRGALIIADYTFSSEGVTSVREVVFKLEEEKLTEGYGAVVQKGGKMSFNDHEQLKFDSGIQFHKLACNR